MKPLKFEPIEFHSCTPQQAAAFMQTKVDEWFDDIIKNAKTVYARPNQVDLDGNDMGFWKTFQHFGEDTHTAKLICIERINKEPCKHEPKEINTFEAAYLGQPWKIICKHCGVRLVAEWKEKP